MQTKFFCKYYLKLIKKAFVLKFKQKNWVSDNILTTSSINILHYNIKMRKYVKIL